MLFPRLLRWPVLAGLALGLGACAVVPLPLAVRGTGARAAGSAAIAGARATASEKKPDAVAATATTAASSRDRPLFERVNRPDLTMTYLPAQRSFISSGSAASGHQVPLKPFLSGRGDLPLRAAPGLPDFSGAKPAGGLDRAAATRPDLLSGQRTLAGIDRVVVTRPVSSRAAPDASRTLFGGERAYAPGEKKFVARGKRQGALDRQTTEGLPLSVDDVRALLNKGPRPPEKLEAARP